MAKGGIYQLSELIRKLMKKKFTAKLGQHLLTTAKVESQIHLISSHSL